MRASVIVSLLPLALAAPSLVARDDDGSGKVCGAVGSDPCPTGETCLTPDQYVCQVGTGCFGTCQKQHAPKVCGIGQAGYDCPDGLECLTIEGAYCGQGLACFGYCTPYST